MFLYVVFCSCLMMSGVGIGIVMFVVYVVLLNVVCFMCLLDVFLFGKWVKRWFGIWDLSYI